MDLHAEADRVGSREQLVRFLGLLLEDHRQRPESWATGDLESYLDGLAGWAEDVDGYFENRGELISSVSPWRLAAMMFVAAKYYD